MKSYIITVISGLIIGGAVIGYINYKNKPDDKFKIIDETKTTTEIIKTPSSPAEYVEAFNRPFEITGKIKDDWFHVSVDDGYKHGYKAFELQAIDTKKNVIQSGYSIFFIVNKRYSAVDLNYLRSFNSFSIGGGLMINTWDQKSVYGIRIACQYKF